MDHQIQLVLTPTESNRTAQFVPAVQDTKSARQVTQNWAHQEPGIPLFLGNLLFHAESAPPLMTKTLAREETRPRSVRKLAQFDPVAIRVLDKRLQSPVRTGFSLQADRLTGVQLAFPLVQTIDPQRKVRAPVMGVHRLVTVPIKCSSCSFPNLNQAPGKSKSGRSIIGSFITSR